MKVAVVGCGGVSALHFDAAFRSPCAQLVAAVDIKPERARYYAEKYGINAYTDYYEMLEKERPDTVHICTPHCFHTEYSVRALNEGINVLCEKPCSVNDEEIRSERDSNPRGVAAKRFSRPPRYDRFDIAP